MKALQALEMYRVLTGRSKIESPTRFQLEIAKYFYKGKNDAKAKV